MNELASFFENRPHAAAGNYLPLTFRGNVLGYIDRRLEHAVREHPETFSCSGNAVDIHDHGLDYQQHSTQLDNTVRRIYDTDTTGFGKWCPETTPVVPDYGETPAFELQRAAVGFFGVLTTGVLLNIFRGTVSRYRSSSPGGRRISHRFQVRSISLSQASSLWVRIHM